MELDLQQDFFALFGLPRQFGIDQAALESAYLALQATVHPDRHAHLSDVEKRVAMQWATQVNEAFRTLSKPLPRARYLLELAGRDAELQSNTAMSPEFLMEQMEWREAVEDARGAADEEALESLRQRARGEGKSLLTALGDCFDSAGDLDAAADLVRRMMFLEKLQHEIEDALEALET